jgi:ferric-dicitrate binding protein FerR (iron transport regulator)
LVGEKKIDSLNDLVATIADPALRAKFESELAAVAEHSRHLVEQEAAVAQAQAEQLSKRDEALAKLRAELFERRLRAWTGFFARESMATYIGALLLIILTVVQIVAMFSQTRRTNCHWRGGCKVGQILAFTSER